MTQKQLNFVNRLLEREGLSFVADDYAMAFSNGRTTVLADLDYTETQAIIKHFAKPNPKEKMKLKILSKAHEMRWETKDGKVDMKRLDAWCVKHTASHTTFNNIPLKDLPKVVSVLKCI
jgi:uncharacterized protein involved in type VI secretion and phage assembly